MTIPGIGYINGGMLLGEIGDIHRFSTSNKLLAFAGLDPSVYQSGNFQAKITRMSKRGSRVLRYALVNAAWNIVRNNATFKAYYDVKRAEGRSHCNVFGHCAGKLVKAIWKMLTDNVELTSNKISVHQYRQILKKHPMGALLKLSFFTVNMKKIFC